MGLEFLKTALRAIPVVREESNELAWQDQLPTKQEWLQQSWKAANENTWERTGEPLDTHTPLAPSSRTKQGQGRLTPHTCRLL